MTLDSHILLFCLVTIAAAMSLSISIVAESNEQLGLKKWAGALALEALAWYLFATHNAFSLSFSIASATFLLAVAQAVKLAAIYAYRGFAWPFWQCTAPVIATLLGFFFLQQTNPHSAVVWGSLVYALQITLLASALYQETESQTGSAWYLLFGSVAAIVLLYLFHALDLITGNHIFSTLQILIAPNSVQLIVFLVLMGLNVTESMGFILMIQQRSDREITNLAMIDPLTGIFNRRAFMARAEKECALAQRNHLPLALLMIDVDHFKKINDQYGHPTGDAVLAELAQILTIRLRKQDTIGRYGGEEFCILLPGTEETGAMAIGETLRSAISAAVLTQGKSPVSVTISIGITVRPATDTSFLPDFNKLLAAADTALYQAKNDGRNRIVLLNSLRTALGETRL